MLRNACSEPILNIISVKYNILIFYMELRRLFIYVIAVFSITVEIRSNKEKDETKVFREIITI